MYKFQYPFGDPWTILFGPCLGGRELESNPSGLLTFIFVILGKATLKYESRTNVRGSPAATFSYQPVNVQLRILEPVRSHQYSYIGLGSYAYC